MNSSLLDMLKCRNYSGAAYNDPKTHRNSISANDFCRIGKKAYIFFYVHTQILMVVCVYLNVKVT